MFDAVRNSKKLVQIFLFLIILPFAFWGVESYIRNVGGANELATVGKSKISPQEFQEALQNYGNQLRASAGDQFKPEMLESPQVRQMVLDGLVVRRLLALQAQDGRLGVSTEQLPEIIMQVPAFQEDGKFSKSKYETLLARQGMNPAIFEERLRQDMVLQQLEASVTLSSQPAKTVIGRWLALQREEREVADFVIKPDAFLGQVKLEADAAQKFYDANKSRFLTPEQAKVDYLVLNAETLGDKLAPSDADLKAWYDSHQDKFQVQEERRASHILILADQAAPEATVKAAQAKAEGLLKQLQQTPAKFAELAKQNSEDPGSKDKGGDLGVLDRRALVKPFADAAFALKDGEMSGLVRSEFGFHIIKVTGLKPGRLKPLDEVRAEVTAEAKAQAGQRKFAEMSEQFSNLVEDQSDSLTPAAEKFHLTVQSAGWVIKGGKSSTPLLNDKLLAALFSDDAIKGKRNTRAVEAGPNTLVAARIAEYKPAAQRPLEEVKAEIEKQLSLEQAGKLAQKDGEAKLAQLNKGEKTDLTWAAPHALTRATNAGLPPDTMRALFKTPAEKLPAYVGLAAPNGSYLLFKVSSSKQLPADDNKDKALSAQFARFTAEGEWLAYLAVLRERYPVKINKALLEAKDNK